VARKPRIHASGGFYHVALFSAKRPSTKWKALMRLG
jgi:hypothetical protein